MNPGLVIRRQTARGYHAVDMRVKEQVLAPGVKHAEETDLGAEMLRIDRDLQQAGGAGTKQQGIEKLLIVERQRR